MSSPNKSRTLSIAELNEMNRVIAETTDWAAVDRQIDRNTANWKRSVALIGIPKPPEVRQKISAALKGRTVPDQTKARISASLREYHEFRRALA